LYNVSMKLFFKITLIAVGAFLPCVSQASSFTIVPSVVMQGEPLMVVLGDTTATTSIKRLAIGATSLPITMYHHKYIALYGVDLRAKTGTSTVVLTFKNGQKESVPFVISSRKQETAPLGIPAKLGGTSTSSAKALVSALASDQVLLNKKTPTTLKKIWQGDFSYPLKEVVVTDSYGYSRVTAGEEIAHKGVDYRAEVGTPVYAINRGVVRVSRYFKTFGNLVAIDHGYGLYSLYLHLSKRFVNEGELVSPQAQIGLSGDTGYAEGAHLHLSIRLDGKAIDPVAFYTLLKDI
jgi:murein DD-endopeptidase MepM/ murein hydrolase activator NlpD